VIAYASHTGTRRNIAAMRECGWRIIICPGKRPIEGMRYAIDNGAWSAYQQGTRLDEGAFTESLIRFGAGADWAVAPDIVAGGASSLSLSARWIETVLRYCPLALIAVQEGMVPQDVDGMLGRRVGLFVGGTTRWKEKTLPKWGALARLADCWLHVGRVNTRRRIILCAAAGATSFDGSSVTRFAKTMPLLDWSRRQAHLALMEEPCRQG